MGDDTSTIGTPSQEPQRPMAREEIIAFFDRRQAAYDTHDAAALAADYAPDCLVDSPTGGTHQGRVAAQAVLQAIFDAFADLTVRPADSLVIDGSRVAQIVTIAGTHIGTFLGVPPTRRSFRFAGVFVYELKDRQIVREHRVYDFTGLLVQIGVLKAKPA